MIIGDKMIVNITTISFLGAVDFWEYCISCTSASTALVNRVYTAAVAVLSLMSVLVVLLLAVELISDSIYDKSNVCIE